MQPFSVIIPARYASTRLAGKPLADIGGKPMVVRVAEQAKASGAARVLIATDHEGVAAAARSHGFEACMTRGEHVSGTDRIAEVISLMRLDSASIVVNVQGDEPLIPPPLIRQVAQTLAEQPEAVMATACHPITDAGELFNPNVVKVVTDARGFALYFSRAPIPYARDAFLNTPAVGHPPQTLPAGLPVFRHIGIYAYRAGFVNTFACLPPAPIEQCEALEQLRVLWHGYRITVAMIERAPEGGVDTPADLARVRAAFDRPLD